VLLVTHETALAESASRRVRMKDGQVDGNGWGPEEELP
jgi:predicted ABC-type transport system involved in lysophospholipase L1 biosynthesis ATPase subunit